MSKKPSLTVADKIQQQLDSFPTGLSKSFDALKAAAATHVAAFAVYKREAEQLFEAIDGADLPTIDQYVREHPPSPGAIGFLVLIARDHYKSEGGRRAAEAAHRENRAMRDQATTHYLAHRSEYANKDRAAEAIAGGIVPAKFGTVRRWLRNI